MERQVRSDRIELTAAQVEEMVKYASVGMTNSLIASIFGVSKDTLERRISEDPKIAAALLKARGKCMGNAVTCLYDEAFNKKNTTLMIFWMKTRGGWKESGISSGDELRDTGRAQVSMAPVIKWNIRGEENATPETIERLKDEWIDKPTDKSGAVASGDAGE